MSINSSLPFVGGEVFAINLTQTAPHSGVQMRLGGRL